MVPYSVPDRTEPVVERWFIGFWSLRVTDCLGRVCLVHVQDQLASFKRLVLEELLDFVTALSNRMKST